MSFIATTDPATNWLTKPPDTSPPPAPPPAPPSDINDPKLEAAKEEERKKQENRRGRSSTILTGPQGLAGPAPIQKKTLLGQ